MTKDMRAVAAVRKVLYPLDKHPLLHASPVPPSDFLHYLNIVCAVREADAKPEPKSPGERLWDALCRVQPWLGPWVGKDPLHPSYEDVAKDLGIEPL